MKKVLLLIDVSNTAIRNLSVNKFLSFGEEWTGGFYGTINELVSYMEHNVPPANIIFCNDMKPYMRDADYPNYKGDRKKKNYKDEKDAPPGWDFYDALADAKRQLQEFAEIGNYPFWAVPGCEGDDLIAVCVGQYSPYFDEVHILSNDTDLNQLFTYPNVRIWKKIGKSKKLYSPEHFVEEFKFDPEYWPLFTALVGTHNGVPGFHKIGPKTATKIITNEALFEEFADKHKDQLNEKLDLIEIPYWRMPKFKKEELPVLKTERNYRRLIVYMEQKGFEITSRQMEVFEPL